MTSKKEKTEKKEIKDEMYDELDDISKEIENLSKNTKLKDIIKKYKNISEGLDDVKEKIMNTKNIFENIDVKKELKDIIDDETYDRYVKEIFDILEKIEKLPLEESISKYKIVLRKSALCENYLKSKKMEIIDCVNNTETESLSTSSSE